MTAPAPEPFLSRGFVAVFLLGFAVLVAIYYEPASRTWSPAAQWLGGLAWLVVLGGLFAFAWVALRGKKSA
ncbi:MAG: hypothetical protein ACYDCK_13435 [Thermoplasmatota archaeon]